MGRKKLNRPTKELIEERRTRQLKYYYRNQKRLDKKRMERYWQEKNKRNLQDKYHKIKISGIYKIINKINGKYYVGSSSNIYQRWHYHKSKLLKNCHFNNYLQNAWNKYGKENFDFVVVEHVISDRKILHNVENKYLAIANQETDKTYNLEFIATGGIRKLRNCNGLSAEIRRNISIGVKKTMTEERKKEISLCMKGKYVGSNNPMFGRKHSKESIEKMKGKRKQSLYKKNA